jgi:uncharacterized protein (TIGR00255 family)
MTGFARGEYKYSGGKITAEIKTVNHKFFELSSRLPGHILFLEDKIRNHINSSVTRGRVNLNLTIDDGRTLDKFLTVDKNLAKRYHVILKQLKNQLGIEGEISISQLIALPDIIKYQPIQMDAEKMWPRIKSVLDIAVERLIKAREKEGAALCKDLSSRVDVIERIAKKIKIQAPLVVVKYRDNLKEKISQIIDSGKIEGHRLETEIALFAKNCDVSEEITRIFAHVKNFKAILENGKEAGRQLDFIAQELSREINTTGAKAQDIDISRWVIQVKEQIEKIREQAQNVE